MPDFEQGFRDAERASAMMLDAVAELTKLARQLQKAAREGSIVGMKRVQERLDGALASVSQSTSNATQSWPFTDIDEEQYLGDSYVGELRRVASERGLTIHEREGRLVSHPSILRVIPSDRAVRVDKKKVSTIRPSYLVGLLLGNQKKAGRFESARFLESLYSVYVEIVRDVSADLAGSGGFGTVVPLDRIYRLFTSLPGSSRDYDRTDFARDVYLLDLNGPRSTRKGASVSFPSSTGARSAKGLFTFVGPDGNDVAYYGIRFSGGG
ncbi:MAG: hypothetical protein OXF11_09000 [Deltaproteobacteria bacterium]|nr:hypothetical protein [Deltaproteobacteria bacterium]